MDWKDHIVSTPDTLVGKPRIAGTRIGVDILVSYHRAGHSVAEIVDAYPRLSEEQVLAALRYAEEVGLPPPVEPDE